MPLSREYTVSLQRAAARTIAAVHARLPLSAVPTAFGRYLDQVYGAARAGAVALDGQNVFVYCTPPGRPTEADVAFGVGATAPFDAFGAVEPTPLPIGVVATTTHWGRYAELGAAHEAIVAWCRRHRRRLAGPRWEVYGHWTADDAQLRTDVFYLLMPTAASVERLAQAWVPDGGASRPHVMKARSSAWDMDSAEPTSP